MAAKRYPNDCAIPDNSVASWVLCVRRLKNIIDKLNMVPTPIPINIMHTGMKRVLPDNMPNIPDIRKMTGGTTNRR